MFNFRFHHMTILNEEGEAEAWCCGGIAPLSLSLLFANCQSSANATSRPRAESGWMQLDIRIIGCFVFSLWETCKMAKHCPLCQFGQNTVRVTYIKLHIHVYCKLG